MQRRGGNTGFAHAALTLRAYAAHNQWTGRRPAGLKHGKGFYRQASQDVLKSSASLAPQPVNGRRPVLKRLSCFVSLAAGSPFCPVPETKAF